MGRMRFMISFEAFVSSPMPVIIVYPLERVDVKQEHREKMSIPLISVQFVFYAFPQRSPVSYTGQMIDKDLLFERLALFMHLVHFFFHLLEVLIQEFHFLVEPLLALCFRAALLLQGRPYGGKPGHDEASELSERGAELRRFFHVLHVIFDETVKFRVFVWPRPV